jgi:hypothetical protein
MNRRQVLVGWLAASFRFGTPASAAQKTAGGPQPQLVANAERAFAATMAKRDARAFAPHIAEGWKQFFDGPTAPFSWEPDIVEVLDSGAMALTSGPVLDHEGKLIGRFNSIWRLERDGQWRVLFDRGAPACG